MCNEGLVRFGGHGPGGGGSGVGVMVENGGEDIQEEPIRL